VLTYYNDNDKFVCKWLADLQSRSLLAEGRIDNRSITTIKGDEVAQYKRCHFFAGIGGWEYALQLAGWPEDEPVWTGSCPCQPFSVAGCGRGEADERHLWPQFFRLINECRPTTIFGEQVAGKRGLGWLARVLADLDSIGYATAAVDLPAAGVGSPQIRQRLFWVAHSSGKRRDGQPILLREKIPWQRTPPVSETAWGRFLGVELRNGDRKRIEPCLVAVVNGFPARVESIKKFGAAIVPQVAATFIASFMEAICDAQ